MPVDLPTLRDLLRNYQAFRSLYEAEGIDTITEDDGTEWCLFDLEYLVEEGIPMLPPRQRQAIYACLLCNFTESDAAVAMGVAVTNPVSMYANNGLTKLLSYIVSGRLPRFREDTA